MFTSDDIDQTAGQNMKMLGGITGLPYYTGAMLQLNSNWMFRRKLSMKLLD